MENKSNFIRDLLVKILLIVIFVFLLMYLFPMPNLQPFYSQIFNDNIQTMKDAAEDYYTTERMPKKVGKSTKMTLQEMLDQKLVLPFVDKDNKECNADKSYVKVTKLKNEYELKVSLTCSKESNYIIEKIGCYNFCPEGKCTLAQMRVNEEKAIDKANDRTNTKIDNNGNVSVVVPNGGRYVYEYEYKKVINDEYWKTGDWRNSRVDESNDVKLVDTRTQYTGQKKVDSGTKLYEQKSYGYDKYYTYDDDWTTSSCTSSNCSLWKERTLYTGQKKIESTQTQYKHEKYSSKNEWTYDQDWSNDTKQVSDTTKLWKERTLYTGQKKVESGTTEYKHRTYKTTTSWETTGWTRAYQAKDTDDIKKVDTRYTVSRTVKTTTNSCTGSTLDNTWYASKPADTSSRRYFSTPTHSSTTTNWTVIDNSLKSRTTHSTYEGDLWYELLSDSREKCTSNCGSDIYTRYYYYRVHKKSTTTRYQYSYCTPTSGSSTSTDKKVIKASELKKYQSQGYTLVDAEYKYKVRKTKKTEQTIWTTSITPPAGYEYTGEHSTTTHVKYEQLNKWVTNKNKLGEYTYNIQTRTQYKYAYKNTSRYLVDVKWTDSENAPEGYEYTGKHATTTTIKYEQLNKWVTNKNKLGDYTYNIQTRKQYKYKYSHERKYLKDTIWTEENRARDGYELTGNTKTTSKTTYIDLGYWVNSKNELGEYRYNIKTRTQYKYKYRHVNSRTEIKWAKNNPGNGFKPTGNYRKTYIPEYTRINRQK